MIPSVPTVLRIPKSSIAAFVACILATAAMAPTAVAQSDQVTKSLGIKPDQPGVDYDQPDAAARKNCKVSSANEKFGLPGWVVFDNTEKILRLFLDRNKDRKLDQWSYYKDGIEVYRDSDNDFDGKLDEFRWLGSAGMRKGVDANEDGEIDRWDMISVQEVASEAFNAIKNQDNARFGRLLVSNEEFKALGLTGKVGEDISKRIENARKGFSQMVRGQKQIGRSTEFVYSSMGQPGVSAASKRDGITKDVVCYDHASVVYKNGESVGNVALGTIVQVNGTWRLIELPEIVDPKKAIANGASLFPMQLFADKIGGGGKPIDDKLGKLYEKFDEVDRALKGLIAEDNPKKNAVRIAALHEQKALVGVDIYNNVETEEKYSWLQNIADTVSDAYQKEEYPRGLDFLKQFSSQLKKAGRDKGLDYISWRSIFADYQLKIQLGDSKARRTALDKLMADLKSFVGAFPKSSFAAEGLFQLGFNSEINNGGNNKQAIEMYTKLARNYGNTPYGERAKGALVRLQGKGKQISFKGLTANGQKFDSASQKGKIVLIHFWTKEATNGLDEIKKINAKWDKEVVVVGANIDMKTEDFQAFMKSNRDVDWTQLHQPGGIEKSELATQIGLISLPMAMLIDKDGKLFDTLIPFNDLDREIQRLTR